MCCDLRPAVLGGTGPRGLLWEDALLLARDLSFLWSTSVARCTTLPDRHAFLDQELSLSLTIAQPSSASGSPNDVAAFWEPSAVDMAERTKSSIAYVRRVERAGWPNFRLSSVRSGPGGGGRARIGCAYLNRGGMGGRQGRAGLPESRLRHHWDADRAPQHRRARRILEPVQVRIAPAIGTPEAPQHHSRAWHRGDPGRPSHAHSAHRRRTRWIAGWHTSAGNRCARWGFAALRRRWPIRARSPPGAIGAADVNVPAGAQSQGAQSAEADGARAGAAEQQDVGAGLGRQLRGSADELKNRWGIAKVRKASTMGSHL